MKMKESVDFIKIKDYAVININKMIPVPKEQLTLCYWKRSAENIKVKRLLHRVL